MTETIPAYLKGTDKVLQAEPAPTNQVVQPDIAQPKVLPKSDAKASAKSAKVMNKNEIGDTKIALRKEKDRARQAAHRAANPEKVKADQAKYRAANREKLKARSAKYYAANSEKLKAYAVKYQAANPEKGKAAVAKYQAANSEKIKAYQAMYRAAKKAEAATTRDNHGSSDFGVINKILKKQYDMPINHLADYKIITTFSFL